MFILLLFDVLYENEPANWLYFIPSIMIFLASVLLAVTALIMWAKNPRWISYMLGATAIITVLSIVFYRFESAQQVESLPRGFVNPENVLALFFLMECLLVTGVPIAILYMAEKIKRMSLQHNVQLSPETTKLNTNESIRIDINIDDIEEEGIVKVYCPKCKKVSTVPQIYLLNSGNCKVCNSEFVPYEDIWF